MSKPIPIILASLAILALICSLQMLTVRGHRARAAEPAAAAPAASVVKLSLDPAKPADFELLLGRGHYAKGLVNLFKQIAMAAPDQLENLMLQATPPGEGRMKALKAGRKLLFTKKVNPALQKNILAYIQYYEKKKAPLAKPDNVIDLSAVNDIDVWKLFERRNMLMIVCCYPKRGKKPKLLDAFRKAAAADKSTDRVYLEAPFPYSPVDFIQQGTCLSVMEQLLFPEISLEMPSMSLFRGKTRIENVQVRDAESVTTLIEGYTKGKREKKMLGKKEVF